MTRSPMGRLLLACAVLCPLSAAAHGVSIRNDGGDPAASSARGIRFALGQAGAVPV